MVRQGGGSLLGPFLSAARPSDSLVPYFDASSYSSCACRFRDTHRHGTYILFVCFVTFRHQFYLTKFKTLSDVTEPLARVAPKRGNDETGGSPPTAPVAPV